MVVYAEVSIPASGFRIGRAFGNLPGVEVDLDRIVPTVNAVVPFIWVRGATEGEVVRATREHGAAEEITVLHEEDGRTLYRVVWNREFRDTVVSIADSDLALLSGRGTSSEWRFEFRCGTKASLSEFMSGLRESDVPVTLVSLTEGRPSRGRRRGGQGITGAQFEALQLAYDEGYFEEPREVTLDDLATEVGITRQAFGGRLRRAVATLVGEEVDPTGE